jgi:hypothetical protein
VAYKTFQDWRGLSEARLSLYSIGMVLLAASLVPEAVVDIYLNWLTGTEPTRFIRRQEAFFRLVIQLLTTAALVPIAIAVTPSFFYAVVPPLFIPAPINALLALYIAAVTLVKTPERGTRPSSHSPLCAWRRRSCSRCSPSWTSSSGSSRPCFSP